MPYRKAHRYLQFGFFGIRSRIRSALLRSISSISNCGSEGLNASDPRLRYDFLLELERSEILCQLVLRDASVWGQRRVALAVVDADIVGVFTITLDDVFTVEFVVVPPRFECSETIG